MLPGVCPIRPVASGVGLSGGCKAGLQGLMPSCCCVWRRGVAVELSRAWFVRNLVGHFLTFLLTLAQNLLFSLLS